MKFRVKIQRDREWRSTLQQDKRFWVNLPDGEYFPVFQSALTGLFHNMYTLHLEYATMELAIKYALEHRLDPGARRRYRRIRVKERVFVIKNKR